MEIMKGKDDDLPILDVRETPTTYPVFNYWIIGKRFTYGVVAYSVAMYIAYIYNGSTIKKVIYFSLVIIIWLFMSALTTRNSDAGEIDSKLAEYKRYQKLLFYDWISRNIIARAQRNKYIMYASILMKVLFVAGMIGGLVVSCLNL